jgi:hypothetical protein
MAGRLGTKKRHKKGPHQIPISPAIILLPPVDLQGAYAFRESMTLALLHLPGTRGRRRGWTIIAAQSTCQVEDCVWTVNRYVMSSIGHS